MYIYIYIYPPLMAADRHKWLAREPRNFTDGYIRRLIAYNYGNRGHSSSTYRRSEYQREYQRVIFCRAQSLCECAADTRRESVFTDRVTDRYARITSGKYMCEPFVIAHIIRVASTSYILTFANFTWELKNLSYIKRD